MPDKLAIAKSAVKFIVGAGVSKVVSDIIKCNTDPETLTDEVLVYTGGAAFGWMAQDAASKHIDAKMDAIADSIRRAKERCEDVSES